MLYNSPKKTSDGRYYLKITTDDGNRAMVQLNDTVLETKFSDNDNVTLTLSDKSCDKINAINLENHERALTSSKEWFGKELTQKTLQAAYTPSLNDNTLNVGKATINSRLVTTCYTHDKESVDLDSLDANVNCDVMVEFSGLWFAKKTFGPIFRLAQIRLKAPLKKKYPDEYLFADDEESAESSGENDEDYI